ncbi:DUF7716 domain-containing protein [Burkholderia cepacia]|uniref:DUF7716 domain-containing protein n=1 Tax=Burkholderia cepacia TaxID=292 RepID=A0A8I1B033_BURCE|nr:hypothetical protein [Burkholderia cepacia]MBA9901911.1 hypothetical protein [Burkholderia cepacia]MBA9948882.1 hypothetical protein [Burkholderia cepacia]MBA9979168.1 hypothetical protein [Burkholderia cepacia]MBA9997852.1 hypothetical protein [Burkholderia cepacia]MBB0005879.1 hypothetical protein [Burkholderia cepacia]
MLATTDLTTEVSLKQILETPGDFSGWLYLPPMPWTLDTVGAFSEDAQHAEDDATSSIALQAGWSVTLNSATIEDIVINAHDQIDEPSIAQLLDAFVFYVENDEFILF